MAIEVLEPNATLEFIPKSEKAKENPTIIHLKTSHVLNGIRRNRLFKFKRGFGDSEVEFAEDEIWLKYILDRIVKIENVMIGGELVTVTSPDQIKEVIENIADPEVASEFLDFIISNAGLTEKQGKN